MDGFKKLKAWNFFGLTVAGVINAIGVLLFLSPLNVYDGGFSGTSVLVSKLLVTVPMAVFLLVLNIPFYLL
ncbi:MAG: YitT family protein, partial [Clostridia bacterium]|nr:YitT family protein [Clostridia bacterium]